MFTPQPDPAKANKTYRFCLFCGAEQEVVPESEGIDFPHTETCIIHTLSAACTDLKKAAITS